MRHPVADEKGVVLRGVEELEVGLLHPLGVPLPLEGRQHRPRLLLEGLGREVFLVPLHPQAGHDVLREAPLGAGEVDPVLQGHAQGGLGGLAHGATGEPPAGSPGAEAVADQGGEDLGGHGPELPHPFRHLVGIAVGRFLHHLHEALVPGGSGAHPGRGTRDLAQGEGDEGGLLHGHPRQRERLQGPLPEEDHAPRVHALLGVGVEDIGVPQGPGRKLLPLPQGPVEGDGGHGLGVGVDVGHPRILVGVEAGVVEESLHRLIERHPGVGLGGARGEQHVFAGLVEADLALVRPHPHHPAVLGPASSGARSSSPSPGSDPWQSSFSSFLLLPLLRPHRRPWVRGNSPGHAVGLTWPARSPLQVVVEAELPAACGPLPPRCGSGRWAPRPGGSWLRRSSS